MKSSTVTTPFAFKVAWAEVFEKVVTGHKRGVLASADELNHGLPCEMERRRIHVVDVKGHGGRVRDLVLLATDDGRRPKTLEVCLEMRLGHAARREIRADDHV